MIKPLLEMSPPELVGYVIGRRSRREFEHQALSAKRKLKKDSTSATITTLASAWSTSPAALRAALLELPSVKARLGVK